MSQEKNSSQNEAVVGMTPAELEAASSGAAIFSNRFYANFFPHGVRIAFAEQWGPERPPQFRTAVILSHDDARALYAMLEQMLRVANASDKTTDKDGE